MTSIPNILSDNPLRPRPAPVYDVPLSVAVLDLSRADRMGIKTAWGKEYKDLDPQDVVPALVWALERKAGRHKTVDEISQMSDREVLAYFPPEPEPESDEDDESGKA